jgi:hypothetical protein
MTYQRHSGETDDPLTFELSCKDEMRVGQKNKLTYRWARKGSRPRAKVLQVPNNISLLLLPARAPELNGQENIWQFMRQNWLSNRVFKSFDDIVDHCCNAWNTLIDQPWKIMSIARRDWAAAGHSI